MLWDLGESGSLHQGHAWPDICHTPLDVAIQASLQKARREVGHWYMLIPLIPNLNGSGFQKFVTKNDCQVYAFPSPTRFYLSASFNKLLHTEAPVF